MEILIAYGFYSSTWSIYTQEKTENHNHLLHCHFIKLKKVISETARGEINVALYHRSENKIISNHLTIPTCINLDWING